MKTGQVSPEQTTDVEATTASQTATVGVPDGQSNEINPVQVKMKKVFMLYIARFWRKQRFNL